MTNDVYCCFNTSCQPRTYKHSALLEVIVNGKRFSVNPELKYFQYFSDDGGYLPIIRRGDTYRLRDAVDGVCPHCGGVAKIQSIEIVFEDDKKAVVAELDDLDRKVAELFDLFKGK